MANPHRGQVSIHFGDESYTLSLSANAICELEDLTGEPISETAKKLNGSSVSMKVFRAVLWAALQDHHPEIDLKGAGAIITDAGMAACLEAIGRAFELAFPEPDKGADDRRPLKATPVKG